VYPPSAFTSFVVPAICIEGKIDFDAVVASVLLQQGGKNARRIHNHTNERGERFYMPVDTLESTTPAWICTLLRILTSIYPLRVFSANYVWSTKSLPDSTPQKYHTDFFGGLSSVYASINDFDALEKLSEGIKDTEIPLTIFLALEDRTVLYVKNRYTDAKKMMLNKGQMLVMGGFVGHAGAVYSNKTNVRLHINGDSPVHKASSNSQNFDVYGDCSLYPSEAEEEVDDEDEWQ
jgi:hypothetical protein